MSAKRTGKTTAIQYEKMILFMEGNRDLAHGRLSGANAKIQARKEWLRLSNTLNCELGPRKEPKQWQATWNDWKCSIKKKWKHIHEMQQQTGGGSPTKVKLTETEERLLAIIGHTSLVGDGETPEGGLPVNNFNILNLPPPPQFSDGLSTTIPEPEPEPVIPPPVPTPPAVNQPRHRKRKIEDEICDNQAKQLKLVENLGVKLDNLNSSVRDCANAIREQTQTFKELISLLIKK